MSFFASPTAAVALQAVLFFAQSASIIQIALLVFHILIIVCHWLLLTLLMAVASVMEGGQRGKVLFLILCHLAEVWSWLKVSIYDKSLYNNHNELTTWPSAEGILKCKHLSNIT